MDQLHSAVNRTGNFRELTVVVRMIVLVGLKGSHEGVRTLLHASLHREGLSKRV